MAVGLIWSKGDGQQYSYLETNYNNAKNANADLNSYADTLRDPTINANIMHERVKLFEPQLGGPFNVNRLVASSIEVAANWYGDDRRQPMWYRDARTRPAEMHRITCESEAYLADVLAAGAESCEFFGQCNHLDYETWITWPSAGFQGQTVRVFRFVPNNYLYNQQTYQAAVGDAAAVEIEVPPLSDELDIALDERRRELDKASVGALQLNELDRRVAEAENRLIEKLAEHPDRTRPAYQGTALALAYDGGLPLIGDVEVQYLEDFLADPREPRLSQPAEEMFEPAGAPASGVRFRWNRSLPSRWRAYPSLLPLLRRDGYIP
jgi:hypothetical protein